MFSGPHGIGKSVTAKKVAEATKTMFVTSVAGVVAKHMNFDLNKPYDPMDAARYQYEVLRVLRYIYEATEHGDTVFDRSPLDSAVYLTMAFREDPEYDDIVKEYTEKCITLTNEHCHVLVIPEADLTQEYEDKHNRPTYSSAQASYRQDYADLLDYYAEQVKCQVIRVPVDKQYENRFNYIMKELANDKNV